MTGGEKVRVLHINETHREVGGQERYFFGLVDGLRERGFDVYSFGFDNQEKRTEKSLVLKTPGYFMKQFNRFVFDFGTYFTLRKWVDEIKPDIIHLHGLNQSTLAILFACRGHRVVYTVHNYGMICPTIWTVTKDDYKLCYSGAGLKCWRRGCISLKYLIPFYFHIKLRNFFLKRLVNVYHAPSKALKIYLNKIGFEPVDVINYFIDLKAMAGDEKKEYDIVFVGRLDEEKGVKFLLDAISILKKDYPKIRAVIVGDGPELMRLQTHAKVLGIVNNVNFVGRADFNAVKKYYAKSRIFVMPSVYREQFGFVGIEAMANGLPSVASNRGGIPEWCVDNQTGLLIDPTKPKEIAGAINKLLSDKKLAKRLGDNGKEYAKKFDKEGLLNGIIKLYKNLLEK
ncbi:MAG: glycosyltransferase family 4 protein [Candidatus Aenigmatarchaeota archaeon]